MFPKVNPITTKSWNNLKEIRESYGQTFPLKATLEATNWNQRLAQLELQDCTFDFSKNYLNEKIFQELLALAEECGLNAAMSALKAGEKINETENRAVLHTALRAKSGYNIELEGEDIRKAIDIQLSRIEEYCNALHAKNVKGIGGAQIDTIVNIGIGGSDLGPAFVNEALRDYNKGIQTYYVNNIDGDCLADVLHKVCPSKTLFVVVSKTFTTTETITNAQSAKQWFHEQGYLEEEVLAKHFIAVTTENGLPAVEEFGIHAAQTYFFWEWVSGRFSLWSAAGISIPLAIGFENYRALLDGAHVADTHFFEEKFDTNIPVIDALLTVWYINFWQCQTQAILPYSSRLKKLVDYLQQSFMESNGKSVDRNNEHVAYATAPIIFGGEGTNSQHSFFQLLHQGTLLIPTQFIAISERAHSSPVHHTILNQNCYAQLQALLEGQDHSHPQRFYAGDKPSTLIQLKQLTPTSIGILLGLYEHRVFAEGVIWNIFSFDQWGVELGKKLAKEKLMTN
ncbi:MAG: glucose-6-phosphate isomerase [Crocinitomicaceae bacterium]|nr:glucose-6-phosphate isomerase [Crocinitomicaceae bacterium]